MKPTHSTNCSASDSLAKLNALSSQNMQNLMNLASHSSDASSDTPPPEPASFPGNVVSIVQPATVTMTSWPCETGNTINDSNRLTIDDINKRYICEKITNLQRSNNTAPQPRTHKSNNEKIAFIPVIVQKDEKTWDMSRIILIDSNNKPFRDEMGEIYSSLIPTHALLHSQFQSPEYKKRLLSYFIYPPRKQTET